MRIDYPSTGVDVYVNACCFQPSKENLENLLDDNVTLSHITNGEKKYSAIGKKEVLDMYETFLFRITTDIMVKSLKIKSLNEENTASMKLIVEETKNDYNGIQGKSRWRFKDETVFTFVKEKDNSLKIVEIFTKATSKQLIETI